MAMPCPVIWTRKSINPILNNNFMDSFQAYALAYSSGAKVAISFVPPKYSPVFFGCFFMKPQIHFIPVSQRAAGHAPLPRRLPHAAPLPCGKRKAALRKNDGRLPQPPGKPSPRGQPANKKKEKEKGHKKKTGEGNKPYICSGHGRTLQARPPTIRITKNCYT